MLYRMVELEEGVEVQYLGVYALKWRHDEWGPPSVGFVEGDVVDSEQYEELLVEHKALQELLAVRDGELAEARAELQEMLAEWEAACPSTYGQFAHYQEVKP